MRFEFIRAERAYFGIAFMCRHLNVSKAGFYAWMRRPESERTQANRALLILIRKIHEENRAAYGSRRIHAELNDEGCRVGRHRVARLMRQAGIRARRKRRFVRTTDSKHAWPVAPNVLQRAFSTAAPNRVWVTDISVPQQAA